MCNTETEPTSELSPKIEADFVGGHECMPLQRRRQEKNNVSAFNGPENPEQQQLLDLLTPH